jgi:hypothetical protein
MFPERRAADSVAAVSKCNVTDIQLLLYRIVMLLTFRRIVCIHLQSKARSWPFDAQYDTWKRR